MSIQTNYLLLRTKSQRAKEPHTEATYYPKREITKKNTKKKEGEKERDTTRRKSPEKRETTDTTATRQKHKRGQIIKTQTKKQDEKI